MARNRRLVEFLRAWATSPWRERFVLDLAGEINDVDRVARVLAETGLDARVKRHGFVTEVQLDKLLASADLALNLRNPTMGEASGSQLRIWAARRASVVSHIGWYGQLPDDCVLKIDPAQEETELRSLLARLAQGQVDLGALAEAGWRRLAAHDPAEYVQALLGWFEREQVRLGRLWTARRQIDVLAKHQAALFPVDGTVMLPELLAQL